MSFFVQGLQPDELDALKQDIIAFFSVGSGTELSVTSIYFEELNKRAPGQIRSVINHLYGAEYISDSILGIKFRIGPVSFFQINTQSADVLFQEAINLGQPTDKTSLLDICCGIGSIGLCFAKVIKINKPKFPCTLLNYNFFSCLELQHCQEVLGVEIIEEAIADAKFNATENGVTNAAFHAGNCDDFIHKFVHEAKGLDILAIVDPPRAGLSKSTEIRMIIIN